MGNSHKGLGIGNSSAGQLTPSASVIYHFFTEELHYWKTPRYEKGNIKTRKSVDEDFCMTFCKIINQADHPVFECLRGAHCYSYIKVDMWSGRIVDSWFQFKEIPTTIPTFFPHSFNGIRSYIDLEVAAKNSKQYPISDEVYNSLVWLFKWHLNLVHMSREYIAGGWLNRPRRKKALAEIQDKFVILNKVGYTDILNKAKPVFGPDAIRLLEEAFTPPTEAQIKKAEERLEAAKKVFKDEQK